MPRTTAITAGGRKTTLRLEPCFSAAFADVARRLAVPVSTIVDLAVAAHPDFNRSSAVRTFILGHYVAALAACEARVAQ